MPVHVATLHSLSVLKVSHLRKKVLETYFETLPAKRASTSRLTDCARSPPQDARRNGATVPQMNAIFGWTGERMALHYIEAANRKKMAADAMHKLMNENRTSIVAPKGEVRHSGQKD